jgi:carbonic anhydrase
VNTDVRHTALEALEKLREGNQRFVDGDRCVDTYLSHTRLDEHLEGQSPFAIVLGCSDSRVPVEIIFDVGVGDLFVIRVAGNVIAPSLVGSIEFAAERFGSRLVVVLGHTGCGAIEATIDSLQSNNDSGSENIQDIVGRIRPAVEHLVQKIPAEARKDVLNQAVRANVEANVNALKNASRILERLIRDQGLLIVGAEYSLATGQVDFFNGIPEQG